MTDLSDLLVPDAVVFDLLREQLRHQPHEASEPRTRLAAPDHDLRAVVEAERPASARIESDLAHVQADRREQRSRFVVELHHLAHARRRPAELRQSRRHVDALGREQASLLREQQLPAPSRERPVLDHRHFQHVGPALAHFGALDPRQPGHGILRTREVDREEPALRVRQQRLLQQRAVHAFELAGRAQLGKRPVGSADPAVEHGDDRQHHQGQRLAILADGSVVNAPAVRFTSFAGRVQVTGLSKEKTEDFFRRLNEKIKP